LKLAMASGVCPPAELGFGAEYYSVVNGVCSRAGSYFGGRPVLTQAVGYAVVLGFGAFFALFTSFLVWLEKRYVGSQHTSEWFNTAGRSVKTGLIASVIVSQWTWAATILQSSNVAWQYGVSGPFWYASGATIQVLLFGVMAIEIKRKAPNAHTVCEIVRARWGTPAHLVFLTFCLLTNVIVTAMLLLGGSAVVNALTGVNVYAASFLIPLGVVVYTLAGGLKATFLASYIHSVVVHAVLVVFVFLVYTSSSKLGSPRVVYDRLMAVASAARDCSADLSRNGQACGPVAGNFKGSYLTMLSSGGLVFGIINIVGNFGTVFVDNGYWMSAIAARPSSTHKGYLLGGLVWFAVPFSLATSLGLGALALDLPLTAAEAAKGLVPPATATALMGKSGSVLLLTMLFMAVTSAGSAELVAVSSLCTYDIYRTYLNPGASGKQILRVSRAVVLGFGCFMGVLAVVLNVAGVSLGWMYLAMGVIVGSAVIPIALLLLWSKANAVGAMGGAVSGCALGVAVWLTVAKVQYGRVNLDTTGRNAPMLAGNLVSILVGGAVHAACSLLRPQHYDWGTSREMITTVESVHAALDDELKEERLVHAKRWIVRWGLVFTAVIVVAWPALSLPARRYSLGYFTLWAAVAIAWGTVGSVVIILLPVAESWTTITKVCAGMFTNDAVYDRLDDVNLRLRAIMGAMPEAEKRYRQLHETEMHPAGTHPANDDDDDNNNNQMMHS
jgi:SSS family transporter